MRKLIPKIVRWDVTGMCNLACLHCYSARKQPPDLDITAIIGIVKIIVDGNDSFKQAIVERVAS